jgi:hypothetical protein
VNKLTTSSSSDRDNQQLAISRRFSPTKETNFRHQSRVFACQFAAE